MAEEVVFSVLIPTYKRVDDLCLCLDQLQHHFEAQTVPEYGVEVIVSDDAQDKSLRKCLEDRYPWVQYVCGPARGPAANRNNAAKVAKGEWLAFTDDDCLPSKNWLSSFFKSESSLSVLEGRTVAERPRERLDEESPINETGGYLWSCNFAIRRELFSQMRGFDESFPFAAMEDVEFRERLKISGFQLDFISEALVVHPWRRSKPLSFWLKEHLSFLHLIRLHPFLRPKNLTKHYFLRFLRPLVRVTLPGIFKYRLKGVIHAFGLNGLYFYLGLRELFGIPLKPVSSIENGKDVDPFSEKSSGS